jgi:hypothetical protein
MLIGCGHITRIRTNKITVKQRMALGQCMSTTNVDASHAEKLTIKQAEDIRRDRPTVRTAGFDPADEGSIPSPAANYDLRRI